MPCLRPALSTPLATQAHPLPVSACSCCSLNYTNIAPSLRKTAAGDTCATPSRTTVTECLGVKWISDAPTKCRTLADVAGVCDNGKVSRVLRMPDCCVLAVASVQCTSPSWQPLWQKMFAIANNATSPHTAAAVLRCL
jgi:hypothetical protein